MSILYVQIQLQPISTYLGEKDKALGISTNCNILDEIKTFDSIH